MDTYIMAHYIRFMNAPYSVDVLERAMFVMVDHPRLGDEGLIEEDEFAAVVGKSSLSLTARRARRLIWLQLGWPFRFFRTRRSGGRPSTPS